MSLKQLMPCHLSKRTKIAQRSRIRGFHTQTLTRLHAIQLLLGSQQRHRTRFAFGIDCYIMLHRLHYPSSV